MAYLVAILIIGITIVPLLFVVIGGFRTTAQINAHPAGWPHPCVLSNYSVIVTSSTFWHFRWNSAAIAFIAPALSVGSGQWPPLRCRDTPSRVAKRFT